MNLCYLMQSDCTLHFATNHGLSRTSQRDTDLVYFLVNSVFRMVHRMLLSAAVQSVDVIVCDTSSHTFRFHFNFMIGIIVATDEAKTGAPFTFKRLDLTLSKTQNKFERTRKRFERSISPPSDTFSPTRSKSPPKRYIKSKVRYNCVEQLRKRKK